MIPAFPHHLPWYEREIARLSDANKALSTRVAELSELNERGSSSSYETDIAFLSGRAAGRADTATEVQRLQAELDGVREALDIASQWQTKIAAALGFDPGEDLFAAVSELGSLRAEVIKSLGFGAEQRFALALNRYVDDEVEKRAGRIDAARLRAVAELKLVQAEMRDAQKEHQQTLYAMSDLREAHQRTNDAVRAALELPPDGALSVAADNLARELKSLRAQVAERDDSRRALRAILDLMETALTPQTSAPR